MSKYMFMRKNLVLLFLIVQFSSCFNPKSSQEPIVVEKEVFEPVNFIPITTSIDLCKAPFEIDNLLNNPTQLAAYYSIVEKDEIQQLIEDCYSYKILRQKEQEIQKYKKRLQHYDLPKDAKIIEYSEVVPNRILVLWMTAVTVDLQCDNEYTCFNLIEGIGNYKGELYVSLLDVNHKKQINTIQIKEEPISEQEQTSCFSIPFAIENKKYSQRVGLRYAVEGGGIDKPGQAIMMDWYDCNGDGDKHEFALYHQAGCATCLITIIGYSKKQDKVINYDFNYTLEYVKGANLSNEIIQSKWIDYQGQFNLKVNELLTIQRDYMGRLGSKYDYNLEYDAENERFIGTCVVAVTQEGN